MDTPSSAAAIRPAEPGLAGEWFTDQITPNEFHSHRLKKTLVREKTRFQEVLLADTHSFGRCLILDGEIQSAERDEFMYHECLVHPAMVLHPSPKDILVLGGGEGATVREVLRHPSVRRATMVDIDREVIHFCKTYLSAWHQGIFDRPKTRLIIDDARVFLAQSREQFDVIFSDLPTPEHGSAVAELYSAGFYRHLSARLKPGGLFVAQAGSGHLLQIKFHAQLYRTLKKLFRWVRPYYVFVPSFNVPWAFLLASSKADPSAISAARVNKRLGTLRKDLRFYDGEAHVGLFHIPKYLRTLLEKEPPGTR